MNSLTFSMTDWQFDEYNLNHRDAEKSCQAKGGHLAGFSTPEEWQFIGEMMPKKIEDAPQMHPSDD